MDTTRAHHSGFALLESLLGVALLSLFFVILVGVITYAENGSLKRTMRAEATFLAEEGVEASRSIRNQDFALLTPGVHGVTKINGYWEFQGESDPLNELTRAVTVTPLDASTTEITSRVTWGQGGQTGEVILSTILTNWRNP